MFTELYNWIKNHVQSIIISDQSAELKFTVVATNQGQNQKQSRLGLCMVFALSKLSHKLKLRVYTFLGGKGGGGISDFSHAKLVCHVEIFNLP